MKKSKKILSVFMALILVMACIPMSAIAADRDTSSLDAYLANENLAAVAETLLTDLGDRKESIVPTILNLVFQLVPDLKTAAEAKNINVFAAETEDLADTLIEYLDKVLADLNLNSNLPDIVATVAPLIGISRLDLNSVNSILQLLVDVGAILQNPPGVAAIVGIRDFGEARNIDVTALETRAGSGRAMTTANSDSVDILYGLFGFLSADNNIAIIKSALMGTLDLGSANDGINRLASLDLEATVNDLMKGLGGTIKKLIYDNLIANKITVTNEDGTTSEQIETAYADSQYASFTSDELLAAALIKLISGAEVAQSEAAAATAMTLYGLIGTYADAAIAKYAIEPLNTTVKQALRDLSNSDEQLKVIEDIVNFDYEFTADTFDFTGMASTGLFENLNALICRVIKTVVTPEVYTALALKEDGNENITDNLTSLFRYVLTTLSANNNGQLQFTIDGTEYSYDFSRFTAANIGDQSLEQMAVAVLKLFFPGWFGEEAPADADSLEELGAYAALKAIDTWMPDDFTFTADYQELVYDADGSMRVLAQDEWFDVIATMGFDVAIYWLNRSTTLDMTQEAAAAMKAAGWTWEDFYEEIVDWALNYISGIPAVADYLETEEGVSDGYGPWYKLNVIINELLPLGFVNGCGDETFTVDTYTFFMDKLFPSLCDLDFDAFADILVTNSNANNPLNGPVISSTLSAVDNLLFSLFEYEIGETASFTKPATESEDGYTIIYDVSNGLYVDVTVIPAIVPEPPTTPPTEPTTEPPTTPPVTDPPAPSVIKGDLDGNSRVSAADARIALRISARLETATPDQLAAGDLDGSGTITASEARVILRVSARLQEFA